MIRNEFVTSPAINHVVTLTGLRAFAALWVAVFHLYSKVLKGTFLYPLVHSGHEGVSIFFILSGFILTCVYKEQFNSGRLKDNFNNFILNRVARVYPLHFLCLVYVAIFNYLFLNKENDIYIFLYNLFLIHGWGIFELSSFSYNGASWSISVEWFWYLLFPLLILLFNKINKLSVAILLVSLCLFSYSLGYDFPYFKPLLQPICWGDQSGTFYAGRLIGHEGIFFCAGVLLYLFVKNIPNGKKWDYYCLLSILALFILFGWPEDMRKSVWIYFYKLRIVLYASIVFSLYKTTGIFKIIFGNKIIVFLGEISFALYMIHQWTVISLYTAFPQLEYIISTFSLPIAIVISSVIYYFFEIPSRKFLRTFFQSPKNFFDKNKIYAFLLMLKSYRGKLWGEQKT